MNLKNVSQTKPNRVAMHSLKDLLLFFPLILLILQLLTGCGSNSVTLVQSTDSVEQSTVLTQEALDQIILSEPTLIASQTNSLSSENYWIAWKDPQGNYIAATRSGVPVNLASGSGGTALNLATIPIPDPARSNPGDLSLDIFDPPGNPLLNPEPLAPDPCFATLEIETVELPPVTRGGPEDFVVRARVRDQNGQVLLDQSGNPVRVQILTEAVRGTVTPATGLTDVDGFFRAKAQILSNLPPNQHYMLVATDATSQLANGQVLSDSRNPLRMDLIKDDVDNPGGGGGGGNYGGARPPNPVSDPCPNCGNANVVGDPHLYSLDRRRYTFQGVGEYILSRSAQYLPEWSPFYDQNILQPLAPFELQARFQPFAGSTVASVTRGIALQLGADRISLTLNPEPELILNGEPFQLEPGGSELIEQEPLENNLCQVLDEVSGICQDPDLCFEYSETDLDTCISSQYFEATPELSLQRDADGAYRFSFYSGFSRYDNSGGSGYGIAVEAVPYFTESERFAHLSFSLSLPEEYTGAVEGLLGDYDNNPNNDLFSSGGILVTDDNFDGLYGIFGDSWRVDSANTLFDYRAGESTDFFTDPNFPSEFPNFTQQQREAAERICNSASIGFGLSKEDCIYDVIVSGSDIAGVYGGERLPIEDASKDYDFNLLTDFIFPPILNIEKVRDDYIVLTNSNNSTFGFNTLPGLYLVRGNTQVEPIYTGEANQSGFFVDMAATPNGIFLIIEAVDRKSRSLLWIKLDGSPPETLLTTNNSLGPIATDGTLAYLFESSRSTDENRFIQISQSGVMEILPGNPINGSTSRPLLLRSYGGNQFLVGNVPTRGISFRTSRSRQIETDEIAILNQLGEYIDTFINPHTWVDGGSIRPSGDFKESSNSPGTITLAARDNSGLLFPNGAIVEQTPGREPRILLKFPDDLRPQSLVNVFDVANELESVIITYARSFVRDEQSFIFDLCANTGTNPGGLSTDLGCQLYIASPLS